MDLIKGKQHITFNGKKSRIKKNNLSLKREDNGYITIVVDNLEGTDCRLFAISKQTNVDNINELNLELNGNDAICGKPAMYINKYDESYALLIQQLNLKFNEDVITVYLQGRAGNAGVVAQFDIVIPEDFFKYEPKKTELKMDLIKGNEYISFDCEKSEVKKNETSLKREDNGRITIVVDNLEGTDCELDSLTFQTNVKNVNELSLTLEGEDAYAGDGAAIYIIENEETTYIDVHQANFKFNEDVITVHLKGEADYAVLEVQFDIVIPENF